MFGASVLIQQQPKNHTESILSGELSTANNDCKLTNYTFKWTTICLKKLLCEIRFVELTSAFSLCLFWFLFFAILFFSFDFHSQHQFSLFIRFSSPCFSLCLFFARCIAIYLSIVIYTCLTEWNQSICIAISHSHNKSTRLLHFLSFSYKMLYFFRNRYSTFSWHTEDFQ